MAGSRTVKDADEALEKSAELKRAQIPVRTTPTTRDRLLAAAAANGRSLTQEIEDRLERSLEADDRAGGSLHTSALVSRIAADIADIEAETGKGWHRDAKTYYAVRSAVIDAIYSRRPPPSLASARMAITAYGEAMAVIDAYEATLGTVAAEQMRAAILPVFQAKADEQLDLTQSEIEARPLHQRAGRALYRMLRSTRSEPRR